MHILKSAVFDNAINVRRTFIHDRMPFICNSVEDSAIETLLCLVNESIEK